nr:hypothetical protein [Tanacetum cinerariifolium]
MTALHTFAAIFSVSNVDRLFVELVNEKNVVNYDCSGGSDRSGGLEVAVMDRGRDELISRLKCRRLGTSIRS